MLCSPWLQKMLNQIIELIHLGLLQFIEAYRLLRRELALSAFGFLSVYFRNTKNLLQSKQIYVFLTQIWGMLSLWGLFITCDCLGLTYLGCCQAAPRKPASIFISSLPRSPRLDLLFPLLMDHSCSNSQTNPKIWKQHLERLTHKSWGEHP